MRTNYTLLDLGGVALIGVAAVTFSSDSAVAASRIFPLHLQNGTDRPITFTIEMGSCYEGTGVGSASDRTQGPVPPGGYATITIARVQGHGCDGKQGYFALKPSTHGGELQHLNFDNGGNLALSNIPNRYHGSLSAKSAADESYTWTIRPTAARLSGPLNARLTKPRNYIAADSGQWDLANGTQWDDLLFVNTPLGGTWGNFYDDCAGIELFHPQHVVRLPNKNGRAYFMVAQSRAHNGYLQVLQTDPGQLDPDTDLVRAPGRTQRVGQYIWIDRYDGPFSGRPPNPIGNWNHPGKMEVIGGVLVVAAQNWAEGAPCFYGVGSSEDALLFYDVRDPEHPRYWGKITKSELGLPEISGVAIVNVPNADVWVLSAYGDGHTVNFKATSVSPNLSDWTRIAGTLPAAQHGMKFNSYQTTTPQAGASPANGVERIMYFDTVNDATGFSFTEYFYEPVSSRFTDRSAASYALRFPHANRHWDSDSLYVTRQGVPIVYTMESTTETGDNGILIQTHDRRNFSLRTPGPN